MNKKQVYVQQAISALLFLAILIALGWLSVRYDQHWDWTSGKRNTLTEATQKTLKAMPDELKFIAFSYPGAEDRATIEFFVQRYQRVKPNVVSEFIDPASQPQKVREYKIMSAGEVVLEYQGRRENLRGLSEQSITGALQRMAYTGESWIVILKGHGERATEGQEGEAISQFAQELKDKGLKVQPLNLIETPKIPDNTSVLVIASPKSALLEGEIKIVQDYVDKGGNLLWLADPDNAPGLDPLAASLGIQWQNGYAVFPDYEALGTGHPGIFAATGYPASPVTQDIQQITLFPLVRSLTAKSNNGWKPEPMLVTGETAWLETGSLDGGPVSMEPEKGDIAGPLQIGMTLTRDRPVATIPAAADAPDAPPAAKPQQRIALVGDADFISNTYLSQFGNQQLGINLIQWLAARDSQLNVNVPKAPDVNINLPTWGLVLIALVFVLLLPLALLGFGVARWFLRRRK